MIDLDKTGDDSSEKPVGINPQDGSLMGIPVTPKGSSALSSDVFHKARTESSSSSSLEGRSIKLENIQDFPANLHKNGELYLQNPDQKLFKICQTDIHHFVDLLRQQRVNKPHLQAVNLLMDFTFEKYSQFIHSTPKTQWEQAMKILNMNIALINEIKPLSEGDINRLFENYEGVKIIPLCVAREYLTELSVDSYLLSKAFKKATNVEHYLNYFSANPTTNEEWKLFVKLVDFLSKSQRHFGGLFFNRPVVTLYEKSIEILYNKVVTLETKFFEKDIKPQFSEEFWNSATLKDAIHRRLNALKLEDQINFVMDWEWASSSLRDQFVKNLKWEDLPQVLEILTQKNDPLFAAQMLHLIGKAHSPFFREIPSDTDFGKTVRTHLFKMEWEKEAGFPRLDALESQDPDWRKSAIKSMAPTFTTQRKLLDFGVKWMWYDETPLKEMVGKLNEQEVKELVQSVLGHVIFKPKNYLPLIKIIFKECKFVNTFRQQLVKDPNWTEALRYLVATHSFDQLNLENSQEFSLYFPHVLPKEIIPQRFQDRSKPPSRESIKKNLGPEGESSALAAVASNAEIIRSAQEKQMIELLSQKFLDSGFLAFINYNTTPLQREKLVLSLQNRIKDLGEIPNDLIVLHVGIPLHSIVISLFKTPGSKEIKMVVTNTGFGLARHSKKPSIPLHTVTEEVTVDPDIFSGENGKEHLLNLLNIQESKSSREDQIKEFYGWVEKTSGKPFPQSPNESDFNKWYPQRHRQFGFSCLAQSTRQSDKYLITRILWEMNKPPVGSDPVALEKAFWNCYGRAQQLITHVDHALLSQFPQEDEAVKNARKKMDKKGIEVFNQIAEDTISYDKALKDLEEASKRTGIDQLPLPAKVELMPKALQLKERCKLLTKSWQAKGNTYAEIYDKLKDMNEGVIGVALARYDYMQTSLNYAKEVISKTLIGALNKESDFSTIDVYLLCDGTLNQLPEKILEDQIGVLIQNLIKEGKGVYKGLSIEAFNTRLEGNRFYHLFKPLIKHILKDNVSSTEKPPYVDYFLQNITPQQRAEINK